MCNKRSGMMQAVFTQHFTSADLMHVCTRVSEPRSVLTFDQPRSASRLPQPSSGMLIASRTPGALARAAIGCIYPGVARQAPRAAGFSTTTPAAAAGHMEVLQPASVFKYFHELTQLPRPSKHEHRVLDWLKRFAQERGLTWKQDSYGNMVIYKPGSGGGEGAPTVIVQGHIDMVCEKNRDVAHDFHVDPITTHLTPDGWLKAQGTTLGADNGVGVAAALALLDAPPDTPLPPLEVLCTVEEEIGLKGASALDGSMLTGRLLVNLDSEDWGVIYIGCAGAGDTNITLKVARDAAAAPAGARPYKLAVSGLQGGHSGLQIHQGLGNAVQLLAQGLQGVLAAAAAAGGTSSSSGAAVVEVQGGDKRNAIPREAWAVVLLTDDAAAAAQKRVGELQAQLQQQYSQTEPGLQLLLQPEASGGAAGKAPLAAAGVQQLLQLLTTLPHGPVKMSEAIPGLVETSTNLASVTPVTDTPGDTTFLVTTSTRSSLPSALEEVRQRIAAAAAAAGAAVDLQPAYAGWDPNPASPLLQLTKVAVAKVTGKDPEVTAIHAGLECGILGQALPGVDMVSFGPTILGAHSPDERLRVDTVPPFWEALLLLMKELAARRAA